MKWKLRIFGYRPEDEIDIVDLSERKRQARAAVERSNRALAEVRRDTPEVNRLSRSLREIRARNHFAEMIQQSFEGTR